MNDLRSMKRRWRYFLVARWLAVIGVLTGGLVVLVAIGIGLGSATANVSRNAPQAESAWSGIAIVSCLVASILGLIGASAWVLRRTATAFGMVCEHCGATFDLASYEYAMETGNCPSCVRRQNFVQTVDMPIAEQQSPAELRTNPYAPPQAMEPQTPVVSVAPRPSFQRTSLIGHVIRIAVMAWMGWLSVLGVTILVTVAVIRLLLNTRLDRQTPHWLQQAVQAQRNRDLACILGGSAIAVVLILVEAAVMSPRVDLMQPENLMYLHNLAGAAAGFGLLCGELAYWRVRRHERVILPLGAWGCSMGLWSTAGWDKASRIVRFRTQDEAGLSVSILDSVINEPLASFYAPCVNPDGWNELVLPLDGLVAEGRSLKRIQIWLQPLDGRPWLLWYDETPRTPESPV